MATQPKAAEYKNSKKTIQKVCVVIPAFNEASVIAKVASSIPKDIKLKDGQHFAIELLFIDDCSDDGTAQIVDNLAEQDHHISVLHHVFNTGAGGATRSGFSYILHKKPTEYTYCLTMDADGQHKSKDIKNLIQAMQDSDTDFIVGSRLMGEGSKSVPWSRRVANNVISGFSNLLLDTGIKDTQSGIKIIKSSHLKHIANFRSNRYSFCTEMLWQAKNNGLHMKEAPISVEYNEYSLSKGQSAWNALNLLTEILWARVSK